MEDMTRTTMADTLDSCVDRLRGMRTILAALGSDLQEQPALDLLADVVEQVAEDVDEVRAALDPEGGPDGAAGAERHAGDDGDDAI